ncbi:hypothetical protein RHS01_05817 [Rhizoctonia solani]|uniref:Reverse transcriptase n=1 Tax=Rhizoctonia solani TaxID=456999 RepID=A0A8H7ICA7_9AGAM|nr:hypothetical protein RHS01_05817 [Rhizoctonia solani]
MGINSLVSTVSTTGDRATDFKPTCIIGPSLVVTSLARHYLRTPTCSSSGPPLTLANPTRQHIPWQPVPGHPLEPLGEVSLKRVTRLLLGLLGQVKRSNGKVREIKEAGIETRTNIENISQAVDVVKDGLRSLQLHGPRTPEDTKPPVVEATPRPLSKVDPIGLTSRVSFWPKPSKGLPTFAQPTPVQAVPPRVSSPPPSPRLRSPIGAPALSLRLQQPTIRLRSRVPAAFGDPDATRAAERKITTLTQSGTCADYITKFRTLAMELDWNDAALRGQFARGLHWEVSRQIATHKHRPQTLLKLQNAALVIDNALCEERASHPPKDNKPSRPSNPARGRVPAKPQPVQRNSPTTPTLCWRKNATAAAPQAPASSAARWVTSLRNAARAGKPPLLMTRGRLRKPPKLAKTPSTNWEKSKGTYCRAITPLFTIPIQPEKKAETIEVLIDSGATSSFLHPRTAESLRLPLIDLPLPRTVTMLDGSSPQAGKIWKKAVLTFTYDGKRMTETFLICNTGSHAAILGLKCHCQEEEADPNPLEGVPSKYHQYAKDKLKAGKIRPSKSSISSPVMFVPKKDGSCCLVVDYRCLNNRTKKNVYPLPRPNDLMAQLRGAKVFTKLDLRWGYNNVRVKEGDEWKTAFCTKYGLYESLVMTFGLTNAPAAFQHFMNELFKDLLDVCVIIYLDDILIYSKDDATHTQHVHEVLRRLMDNQLFCKASKCTFHVTSVEYLGIIVSDKGFSLDKLKIWAVQEWPTPTKVKEVQSFLGFANFLRRFVANFSHMARPLHNLVKKDVPWKWDTREQEAFQGLKDAITNAPVLCHVDPTKPYFLETDASGAALGSILSQRQEDSRLHPLGFLSKSFKGAEQNYDTHDKELLAIIRSFEYWRIFLEGTVHPVTVFTNHRNLEYLKESLTFNRRHARWHLLLAGYNFQIVYRPGKQSGKPDALSRCADHADIPPAAQTMLPDPVFANVALVTPEKELQRQIKASLDQDESLEEILQFLQNESKAPPPSNARSRITRWRPGCCSTKGKFRTSRKTAYSGISIKELLLARKPKYASIPPQPLELPARPWQHVSYNMIVDLPKDGNHDSILVIIDSFTKYGIFVKCSKKLKAPELAELFLEHVWKRHGMPEKTVSDRGRVFNNNVSPQSDGQTERVNPSIEHFLRAYSGVNQQDWTKWLPMAEFAYNNAVHSSTGKTPFKALYGWEPTLTPSNVPTDVPEADELAQTMEAQWKELTEQRLGPFKVTEKISNRAYRLELPPTMRIHNVFYVGLLSKVKRDNKRTFENRPPPVTVDGEEEYEVEGITNAEERDGKWFFRVKWKGYGSEENTWEPKRTSKMRGKF